MQIRVLNNQIGCFNIMNPSKKSFEFSMAILDDTNKTIEVDGVKAVIKFSGEPDDKYYFESPLENLGEVFGKCFEYGDRVWSSTDYKAQCLLFAKLYQENLEVMDAEAVKKHKEKTQKKIDELQKELNWNTILPDLTDDINSVIDDKIAKIKKSVAFKEKELLELKENSESYAKVKRYLDICNGEIERYKQCYIV